MGSWAWSVSDPTWARNHPSMHSAVVKVIILKREIPAIKIPLRSGIYAKNDDVSRNFITSQTNQLSSLNDE